MGPWCADEIMSMWSEGELNGNHRVALAGASEWVPLGALLGSDALDDAYWEEAFAEYGEQSEEEANQVDGETFGDLAWHVNDGSYTLGPYSWDAMRQLYLEGRLDPSEHWVSVGGQDWIHPAEAGFVEDENDWGGWYVLTPGPDQEGEESYATNGPYLASDIAHYIAVGLIDVDALVSCGDSEWCSPEDFGFVFPDAFVEAEDLVLEEALGDDEELVPEPLGVAPVPYKEDEEESVVDAEPTPVCSRVRLCRRGVLRARRRRFSARTLLRICCGSMMDFGA